MKNNPARGPITDTYNGKTSTSGEASVPSSVAETGMTAVVAVNSPYAARLHELGPGQLGPRSAADGGVGPKFVEAKLIKNADKYAKIFADHFSKAMSDQMKGET